MRVQLLRAVIAILFVVGGWALCARAQLIQPESLEQGFVLLVNDKTGFASTESPILLASNHNGWNPNDPTQALSRRSDGKWQIVRPKPALDSRLNFKFTRGSWETVEVDAGLAEIENRLLPLLDPSTIKPGEPPVIELVIEKWKDQRPPEPDLHRLQPYRELEVNGDVRRLEVVLRGRARDLLVWVPPGFGEPGNAGRTYPVMWMLDGQAAFENVPAIGGEWDADSVAAQLVDAGSVVPLIIVAIPGAATPEARASEYGLNDGGPALLHDLAKQAAPRVRRALRGDTSRAMIVGAGIAGRLAQQGAHDYPDVFGEAFSPTGESRPESEGVPFDAGWSTQVRAALAKRFMVRPPSGLAQPGVMKEPELLPGGFMLVVNDKSGKGTNERPLFVPSNHNGWNPADQTRKMTRRSDGKWQIGLPASPDGSRMAFKVTLGSWDTVEVTADMNDIANRELPLVDAGSLQPGERPIIEITVDQFRDPRPEEAARLQIDPYREIVVAGGSLRRIEVAGGPIPVRRDVLVWLPPGYHDAANVSKAYPILYLHDGQNVFEKLPNVPGEWQADETAARLIEADEIEPVIIVGVPSLGLRRIEEYQPIPVFNDIPARGDAHVEWLTQEVIPRVERTCRVREGRENRFVGGSSLGAVIALHAATVHPELFGGVLLESPAMLAKDGLLLKYFAEKSRFPTRAFVAVGTHEVGHDPSDAAKNAAYLQSAKDLYAMLGNKGIAEGDRVLVVGQDAIHNEDAWAKRFPEALRFFFPPLLTGK